MQTFLPYTYFRASVAVLDNRHLCKQIVEAWQIYTGRVPQPNHPACLMWAGARPALARYIFRACEEYADRFGKDHSIFGKLLETPVPASGKHVFDDSPLMRLSHCVSLARKNVAQDEMIREAERISGLRIPLESYPQGYFWPVQPVGRKARADSENWLKFWESTNS